MISIKTLEAVPSSECSSTFLQAMYDRMVVSFFKYGLVRLGFPQKMDAIATCKDKIKQYEETGNLEWLVDAANYCMIEFMHPRKTSAHFRPTDSTESRGRVKAETGALTHEANTSKRSYQHEGD